MQEKPVKTFLWNIISLLLIISGISSQQTCEISTSDNKELYAIGEDFEINRPIFRLTISPKDAVIDPDPIINGQMLARYRWRFKYQLEPEGTVALIANDSLTLPKYPSTHMSAPLQFKLSCYGSEYSVATLQIKNVNSYSPKFYGNPYSINISEAMEPGTAIDLPALAIDWDPAISNTVTFSLKKPGNSNNTFSIVESTNIQDISSFSADEEDGPELTNLFENGRPAQLPRRLKLVLNRPLDFEYGTRLYNLYIEATDNGGSDGLEPKTSFVSLKVNIMDYDDSPPSFFSGPYRGNISIDAEVGTEVHFDPKIVAVDGDPAIQAPISYSLMPDGWTDYFTINHTTGAIFLSKKLPSTISQSSLDLIVHATELWPNNEEGRWANSYVHIDIVYSSSRDPEFTQCRFETSIQENTVLGAQVIQLTASDPDQGDFGKYLYRLLNSTDAQAFDIDENSGVISVKIPDLMDRVQSYKSIINLDVISQYVHF